MRLICASGAAIVDGCLAAGLCVGIVIALFGTHGSLELRLWSPIGTMLVAVFFGWMIAIPVFVIICLPMHAVLSFLELTSQRHYALAGGILGVLPSLLTREAGEAFLMLLAMFVPGAMAGALSFRRVLDGGAPLSCGWLPRL